MKYVQPGVVKDTRQVRSLDSLELISPKVGPQTDQIIHAAQWNAKIGTNLFERLVHAAVCITKVE